VFLIQKQLLKEKIRHQIYKHFPTMFNRNPTDESTNMRVSLVTTVTLLVAVQQFHTLEVIIAINAGGPAYDSTYDVHYIADTNDAGTAYNWTVGPEEITMDEEIYANSRNSGTQFSYTLPLKGNGCYVLYLHFHDDSTASGNRQFDVVLNGAHTVLSNFDMFAECGQYNVCNQAIYFCVCQNTVHWNGTQSSIVYNQLDVEFVSITSDAVVDGILLMKGNAGEAKTIIPKKSIIFFDPAYQRKCVVPRKRGRPQRNNRRGRN
jgi:Malectin domain